MPQYRISEFLAQSGRGLHLQAERMSSQREPGRLDELLAQAGWLDRLARRLVLDPAEADEVVQETWMAALRGKPESRSVRGWLAQIARNVVLQRGRAESARRARERTVARSEASEAESEALERAQAQQRLVEAVLALDEPCRGSVILHYFDHLSVAEIARKLGVPEPTVRTRLSRGVGALRERLQREGGKDWALAFLPLVPKLAPVAAVPWIGVALMTAGWKYATGATVAALLVWLAWPHSNSTDPLGPSADATLAHLPAEIEKPAKPEIAKVESTEQRAPLAVAPPAKPIVASDRAALDVHVRWGDDGTDAVGVGVSAWQSSAPDPFTDRREAHTDEKGRVHFEDLAPGYMAVETDRSDGEGPTLAAGELRAVELTIADGFDLHGQVVDADDRPVAGARIWLSQYFNTDTGTEVATSGASGEFTVRDVGRARYVGARHERYGPSPLEYLKEARIGERVETKLVLARETAELTGFVHDEQGKPIAGANARVEVATHFERDVDGRMQQTMVAPFTARTDESGKFALRGLSALQSTVIVRAQGFAPLTRVLEERPGRSELDFALAREAAVHGRVVDALGAPLKGVFVGYGVYGAATSAQTRSHEDGGFRLVGLQAGTIEVRADGEKSGKLRRTFQLHPGDDVEWQVQLVANPGVVGRVIDAAGKPAAGFMVGAVTLEHPGGFMRSAKTDAGGHFELGDWPAEAQAIEVREEGAWVGIPAALVEHVQPGGPEIEIRLAADALRSAYFAGRVLDESGKPFEGAEVSYFVESTGQGQTQASDAQGRFHIGPLHPGRYFLQVRVKGYATSDVRGLALSAGETRDLGDLRLLAPGEIHVHLSLPAGVQPEELQGYVFVTGPDGEQRDAIEMRDSNGRLGGLAPGRYRLLLASDRLRAAPATVELRAHETAEVELRAEPGTLRMLRLTLPAGTDEPRIQVRVRDAAGNTVYEDSWTRRGSQPVFGTVPGLALGQFRVEASTAGGLTAKGALEVLALEPSSAICDLELR
jgi:RNA polymerase sigma-70 factor, ECF subfamily